MKEIYDVPENVMRLMAGQQLMFKTGFSEDQLWDALQQYQEMYADLYYAAPFYVKRVMCEKLDEALREHGHLGDFVWQSGAILTGQPTMEKRPEIILAAKWVTDREDGLHGYVLDVQVKADDLYTVTFAFTDLAEKARQMMKGNPLAALLDALPD